MNQYWRTEKWHFKELKLKSKIKWCAIVNSLNATPHSVSFTVTLSYITQLWTVTGV